MAIEVRQAGNHDLPQVQAIFEYYVLNTVVSFLIQKPPSDYIKSRFEESKKRRLPYLVAIEADAGKIVGYAYASAFRGFMLGYGHSVEMTVFCHPEHRKKGIGDELMDELLKALRATKHISQEAGHEENLVEFNIKKVFAVMAVDEAAPRGGLALRDWYMKWGFEEVGRLKGVGFKKDRV
jgi:L-amino acid N-acyltransferase YncA